MAEDGARVFFKVLRDGMLYVPIIFCVFRALDNVVILYIRMHYCI